MGLYCSTSGSAPSPVLARMRHVLAQRPKRHLPSSCTNSPPAGSHLKPTLDTCYFLAELFSLPPVTLLARAMVHVGMLHRLNVADNACVAKWRATESNTIDACADRGEDGTMDSMRGRRRGESRRHRCVVKSRQFHLRGQEGTVVKREEFQMSQLPLGNEAVFSFSTQFFLRKANSNYRDALLVQSSWMKISAKSKRYEQSQTLERNLRLCSPSEANCYHRFCQDCQKGNRKGRAKMDACYKLYWIDVTLMSRSRLLALCARVTLHIL